MHSKIMKIFIVLLGLTLVIALFSFFERKNHEINLLRDELYMSKEELINTKEEYSKLNDENIKLNDEILKLDNELIQSISTVSV